MGHTNQFNNERKLTSKSTFDYHCLAVRIVGRVREGWRFESSFWSIFANSDRIYLWFPLFSFVWTHRQTKISSRMYRKQASRLNLKVAASREKLTTKNNEQSPQKRKKKSQFLKIWIEKKHTTKAWKTQQQQKMPKKR